MNKFNTDVSKTSNYIKNESESVVDKQRILRNNSVETIEGSLSSSITDSSSSDTDDELEDELIKEETENTRHVYQTYLRLANTETNYSKVEFCS